MPCNLRGELVLLKVVFAADPIHILVWILRINVQVAILGTNRAVAVDDFQWLLRCAAGCMQWRNANAEASPLTVAIDVVPDPIVRHLVCHFVCSPTYKRHQLLNIVRDFVVVYTPRHAREKAVIKFWLFSNKK